MDELIVGTSFEVFIYLTIPPICYTGINEINHKLKMASRGTYITTRLHLSSSFAWQPVHQLWRHPVEHSKTREYLAVRDSILVWVCWIVEHRSSARLGQRVRQRGVRPTMPMDCEDTAMMATTIQPNMCWRCGQEFAWWHRTPFWVEQKANIVVTLVEIMIRFCWDQNPNKRWTIG